LRCIFFMSHSAPIGFFDSGVGGLTIWKAVVDLLPHEHTVYLADSAYAPYGERTPEQILERSQLATQFLLSRGCKIVVVACNTATTNAIAPLRSQFSVPFIGIEPAVKPAALSSKTKSIGVLATKGTLTSALFKKTAREYAEQQQIQIVERMGKGLVPLIEDPKRDSAALHALLHTYLAPMKAADVDFIVLGCTHYPIIRTEIAAIAGPGIAVIDAAQPVANQTRRVLERHQLLNQQAQPTIHQFFTTGDPIACLGVMQQLGIAQEQLPLFVTLDD
jgi:glutamate racemase